MLALQYQMMRKYNFGQMILYFILQQTNFIHKIMLLLYIGSSRLRCSNSQSGNCPGIVAGYPLSTLGMMMCCKVRQLTCFVDDIRN
jgi:hypothetical protein